MATVFAAAICRYYSLIAWRTGYEGSVVTNHFARFIGALSLSLTVAACGGGGGGSIATPPPPPPPPPTAWQPGVFLDSATFADRCSAPRSGADPTNSNRPYPDIQGTVIDENNFLRSFSDETYLWYDEITDQDPALFGDPITYFGQLKTFATLPSGRPKDPDSFHFSFDTQAWFDLFQSGITSGYGVQWFLAEPSPPNRVALVSYTEPNSPATDPAVDLIRSEEVISVDGEPVSNGDATILNAGLFPETIGETHTFEIRNPVTMTTRMVSMTSAEVNRAAVQGTRIIDSPAGKVGYLVFNTFSALAEEQLIDAVNQLIADAAPDPVAELIVDLRYNGGGFGLIASQLAYMIAGPVPTTGRTFDLLQFNDKHPATNPITGQPIQPDPFRTTTSGFFMLPAGQPLPTLDLSRVFVLTGSNTASASELLMNGLRGIDFPVIQVGSTTRGKPYGFYETPNCGTSYFTVQFRSVNAKDWGDYAEGFQPAAVDDGFANVLGCPIADDFSKELGDVEEDRLEVALAYAEGLGCVLPMSADLSGFSKPIGAYPESDGFIFQSPMESNRIELRPRNEQ